MRLGQAMVAALLTLVAAQDALQGKAAEVFAIAKQGKWYEQAAALKPTFEPMSEDRSYFVVWKATPKPKKWIVSLHGQTGFATDDLANWNRHVKDRDLGLICVQWYTGGGNVRNAYLPIEQVHVEIDRVLDKLGVKPGTVMLHGFSRGSANSYALAAMDAGKEGRRYFSLCVASSGGVGLDYPPTMGVAAGRYGEKPLKGTKWVTSAGAQDRNQQRDGIEGMRRAASWLEEQGAEVVFSIEDSDSGHGALMLNPANAKRVLDYFLKS